MTAETSILRKVKIFADTGEPSVHLTLVHSSQSGQGVNLVYEPKRG